MAKDKVKVGVVGCGVVAAAYYLPYLMTMDKAEIRAVCDLRPVRTEACVRVFGAREQYADYYDMLEKSEIDAVFILTAPVRTCPSRWRRSRRVSIFSSRNQWRPSWTTRARSAMASAPPA